MNEQLKSMILRRYFEIMQNKNNKNEVLEVLKHDLKRTVAAEKKVYKIFIDEIELDIIKSINTLIAAYIVEEQI